IRARQAEHADIARRHREAAAARKAAAEKTSTLAGEQAALTARIEALDKARADALAAAAMPLPDLSVGDDGLLYRGLPFSQACDGERIRVSVAIAMALSPGLRDIIIRNGALLDEVGLATIAGQADAAGYRLWVERVGTGDPGAIVFVDGAALDAAA
ncbi:MAG: hypothetical protein Q8Q14_04660, partial [Gemmatimonadales bacterium]|nr:hypothetical protein [Gemmatimonadales bacterium]